MSEECRRQVFARLTPPFEELFDSAEEHTLTLLLEPWTLLTSQDTQIYEQVRSLSACLSLCVWLIITNHL